MLMEAHYVCTKLVPKADPEFSSRLPSIMANMVMSIEHDRLVHMHPYDVQGLAMNRRQFRRSFEVSLIEYELKILIRDKFLWVQKFKHEWYSRWPTFKNLELSHGFMLLSVVDFLDIFTQRKQDVPVQDFKIYQFV